MIDLDKLFSTLKAAYPNADCELNFNSNFELLVAVILSAQCTDKRVNEVTKHLFKVASTPEDFANLDAKALEKMIFSCGFYRNKAASIINAARGVLERFNGQVPNSLADLTSLKGVGRKTANVVLAVAFNQNALAVDTHVFRVSHRLGLTKSNTPKGVEADLTQLLNGRNLSNAHHLLLFHGRYCCKSQRPMCDQCPVCSQCSYENKSN